MTKLDKPAQDKLVVDHLPLAYRLAKEWKQSHGGDLDDLRQEASLALVKCVRSFDSDRGVFATLARASVRNHFLQLAERKTVPTERLTFDPVAPEKVASADEDRLVRLRSAIAALAMLFLSDTERQIVLARLAGDKYQKIAVAMGVTKQRVHQLAERARWRMMQKLEVGMRKLPYVRVDNLRSA